MEVALRQDALSETLGDVQNLIYGVIHKFINRYGYEGDYLSYFEELNAAATLIFIIAFDNYKPSRASFTTWIHFTIWNGLKNTYRTKSVRATQTIKSKNIRAFKVIGSLKFTEIFMDASQDARYIITLILDMPKDLQKITLAKGTKPRNVRAAIRKFLLKSGWSIERIRETFNEIQTLLLE